MVSERRRAELEAVRAAAMLIPVDKREWQQFRDKFKKALRRSKLTLAVRMVGLTIADDTIQRNPSHQRYGMGWMSECSLAEAAGVTERSVRTALKLLARNGWIVLARGTGPGRSNVYTISLRNLGYQNRNDRTYSDARSKYRKDFPVCTGQPAPNDTAEKCGRQTGKATQEHRKEFPPTPIRHHYYSCSAEDQARLAEAVGDGDRGKGYEILLAAAPSDVDRAAIALRDGEAPIERLKSELILSSAEMPSPL